MGGCPSPQEHSCYPPGQLTGWCRELLRRLQSSLSMAGKIRPVIAAGDADEGPTGGSVNIITLLLIHT